MSPRGQRRQGAHRFLPGQPADGPSPIQLYRWPLAPPCQELPARPGRDKNRRLGEPGGFERPTSPVTGGRETFGVGRVIAGWPQTSISSPVSHSADMISNWSAIYFIPSALFSSLAQRRDIFCATPAWLTRQTEPEPPPVDAVKPGRERASAGVNRRVLNNPAEHSLLLSEFSDDTFK